MSQGLFELRKDAITSWWVATIIDRTFARERFALRAGRIDDRGDCFNCRIPQGDGVRLRVLKDFAFTVAGTEEEARTRDAQVAQLALSDARAAGSWRTVVAPPGEHRPLHAVGEPYEVRVRIAARAGIKEKAERVGEEVEALWTNGPGGGGGARKYLREQIGVVSTLIERERVRPELHVTEYKGEKATV